MNEARRTFYTNFIKENSDDQGKLFKAVNKLLVAKDDLCFPNYHNNTVLATDIGEFFVRKISRIRSDIDAMVVDSSVSDIGPDDRVVNTEIAFNSFWCLTENEVQDLIQASAKKSCALDPIPTSLVIRLTPLRPVMTHIINFSCSLAISLTNGRKHSSNLLLRKRDSMLCSPTFDPSATYSIFLS